MDGLMDETGDSTEYTHTKQKASQRRVVGFVEATLTIQPFW